MSNSKTETLEDVLSDPVYNFSLKLPSSQIMVDRILSNEVLKGHFRPDLKTDSWYNRPSPQDVDKAFESVIEGLHRDTVWRTARDYGVYWNHKTNKEVLRDLSLVLYAQLGGFK